MEWSAIRDSLTASSLPRISPRDIRATNLPRSAVIEMQFRILAAHCGWS